jgi:hypothetical protein
LTVARYTASDWSITSRMSFLSIVILVAAV